MGAARRLARGLARRPVHRTSPASTHPWALFRVLATLAAVAGIAGAPRPLAAQRVLGPTDDATVLPRGVLRLGIQPTWGRANERFADGLGRAAKGTPERLGADYDLDSLTPANFEPLRALAPSLAILTGKASNAASLGRLRVDFDASSVTTPIALEYGITRRIMLGVLVPYVKTRNEVSLIPNPARNEGSVGINPALSFAGARTQNLSVFTQLSEAATQLQAALTSCQGSTAPECSAINADRARAQQLAATGLAVATAVERTYGTLAGLGARFVPVQGSALHNDVAARLAALSTDFAGFLGAPASRSDWIAARPVGAPLMGLADLRAITGDTAFGILAVPLETVERSHIGDVEVGGKILLYDGLGGRPPQRVDYGGVKFRLAVGGAYRFGTGQVQSADDFADIGTGDAQDDIEGRLFADVLVGRRFWTSVVARYGVQQADAQFLRITEAPSVPFAPAYRRHLVSRDLGDYIAAEISPRYGITDALMVSASYAVFRKGEDSYTGSFAATDLEGQAVTLDASVLNAGTARMEQRLVAGFTYSTMHAYYRGRSALPLEVSYMVGQSLRGDGRATKQFTSAIGFRLYSRLFGSAESRPERPPRRAAPR